MNRDLPRSLVAGLGPPRRGWAAAALSLLLAALCGCWPDSPWHTQTVRPPADSPQPASHAEVAGSTQQPPTPAALAAGSAAPDAAVHQTAHRDSHGQENPPVRAVLGLPIFPDAEPEEMLDLAKALELAGAANPTIALAREAVQASLAEQLQARAMLLPTLEAGASFDLHRGNLQSSSGIIEEVDRQSLYGGLGAAAAGAGTVTIPGILVKGQLAEAFFEPKAARERVAGRQFDALATRNNILLDVTAAWFTLVGAQAGLDVIRQSERDLGELAKVTSAQASTGQGRPADAERVGTQVMLLKSVEERAREEVGVAAAELARLLSMDPSVRFQVPVGSIPLVELVPPGADLQQLLQIALQNRPEMGARAADVAFAEIRLREERVRPFVPFVQAGVSYGDFGGGSNLTDTSFGHFNGRGDVDAMAVWSLQNAGLGNLAVQRQRRAQVREARVEQALAIDQIRREVAEAAALVAGRRQAIDVSRRRLTTAEQGFRRDLLRVRNLAGLPIEVLNSANLLTAARQELVRTLIAYNLAQFQLFVALGQPPG